MKKIILLLFVYSCLQYGYAQQSATDSLHIDTLKNKVVKIKEVTISSRLSESNIKSGSTGLLLDVNELKLIPRLIGESDPFKALQYMGGVSQASEANAGLYVRGGNNDQNLILLNGTQIQNATHVLGIFSIFNPDLVGQMKFFKSGIPAEYGGRLSSVVDINSFVNPADKLKIDGSIGLISSRITTQVPINQNLSIYGSIRSSYISSIILPLLHTIGLSEELTKNKYEFWDTNAGFIWKIAARTKLTGHFYTGKDDINIMPLSNYNLQDNSTYWKNDVGGIRLNHLFNDNWSTQQQLNYSGFKVQSKLNWYNSIQHLSSSSKLFNYKGDFLFVTDKHHLKFGIESAYTMTYPNFVSTDSVIPIEIDNKHNNFFSIQNSLYIRDEFETGKWQFNAGIRANIYNHIGPYTDYRDNNEIIKYNNNQLIKTYWGLEPRLFTRYMLTDNSSLKISASRHIQYLNQIPIINYGIPADLQLPASLYIKPQSSWHFSGGYFCNFKENNWEFSSEAYYKSLNNQLEFKSGITEVFTNAMLEKYVLTGKGWTYGTELKIRKNYGSFTGWVSYNLAWSFRKFAEINKGNPFLARNDRRHDLSVVALYDLNKRWNFSAVFVYATGNRLNLPLSWYIVEEKVILEYVKYNSFEMPAYHRLDLSANCKLKAFNKIKSELNFSIYNVYNRANPYQVFFSTKDLNNNYDFKLKMSYLLPIIPSISWTFHY